MPGYIALCPHFHQPHFQLERVREEVFRASYLPWMELLEWAAEELEGFKVCLHLSGPWLQWIGQEKPSFCRRLARLAASPRIGLAGGLVDEAFVQLSSRRDDFYFQIRAYDRLCRSLTGVSCQEWQALHLVEREGGELALMEISRAAGMCGTKPILLLDVETFYQPYYSRPGNADDLGRLHYSVADPCSTTTCAHLPADMLMYPLRDEIAGQEFYGLPVHSQFRYQFLKRQPLAEGDRTRIEPRHYLFYVKDRLAKARSLAARLNHHQPPIAVIFEDAEKLGQWSGDPRGDLEWMKEFFIRVETDPEVAFTSPGLYLEQHGFFETYPVASSRSYPEWEKWTARRGIRGINLHDERLRKTTARLRDCEALLDGWERQILEKAGSQWDPAVKRAVMESAERFGIIEKMMSPAEQAIYSLVNRIRHMCYQEDPKWASRHPAYGAAPYYDMHSLACLELSMALLESFCSQAEWKHEAEPGVQVRDWEQDGCQEWILRCPGQYVVISPCGGCVSYYHRLDPDLAGDPDRMKAVLEEAVQNPLYAAAIQAQAGPLVLTETDSELSSQFYEEGGRVDHCRNSFRCQVRAVSRTGANHQSAFHNCPFEYESSSWDQDTAELVIIAKQKLEMPGYGRLPLIMRKSFKLSAKGLKASAEVMAGEGYFSAWPELQLVMEAVTSVAPSDEINLAPESWLEFNSGQGGLTAISMEMESRQPDEEYRRCMRGCLQGLKEARYYCRVTGPCGRSRLDLIQFTFDVGPEPAEINVRPAVKAYLSGLVFAEQSRMGYASSGICLELQIPLDEGRGVMGVTMNREFQNQGEGTGDSLSLVLAGKAKNAISDFFSFYFASVKPEIRQAYAGLLENDQDLSGNCGRMMLNSGEDALRFLLRFYYTGRRLLQEEPRQAILFNICGNICFDYFTRLFLEALGSKELEEIKDRTGQENIPGMVNAFRKDVRLRNWFRKGYSQGLNQASILNLNELIALQNYSSGGEYSFLKYALPAIRDLDGPMLDAGCGSGFAAQVMSRYMTVYAIDASRVRLARARAMSQALAAGKTDTVNQLLELIQLELGALEPDESCLLEPGILSTGTDSPVFIEGRLDRLPFDDAHFGCINCLDVIEHTSQPGFVIAELARVCRPGGRIALTVPSECGELLQRLHESIEGTMYPAMLHLHHFDRHALQALMEARGWREIECTEFDHIERADLLELAARCPDPDAVARTQAVEWLRAPAQIFAVYERM